MSEDSAFAAPARDSTRLLDSPGIPDSGSMMRTTVEQSLGGDAGLTAGTVQKKEVRKNQLGTINGCYVPCLLNIMGIVLFLRLSWGVGQLGVSGVLLFFLLAECQAVLTVLSLSAMVSNGHMRGGGSYFMISRTLGPEFGGSIGILFYAAYCIGAAFYCTGFAEEIVSVWMSSDGDAEQHPWLVVGTLIALIALFQRGNFVVNPGDEEEFEHHSWSFSRFQRNWTSNCESEWGCYNFQTLFGILFPAATGIMEGANLSGDQKKPSIAIPYGTLSALLTSIITYLLLIVGFAGSFESSALCQRYTLMQESSYGSWGTFIVILGVIISASSSALGSLFGGSRVLQAIARDKLFPRTSWLAYGSSDGDEPRIAVLFTWVIAQLLCLIGSVNLIAPIATAIFCMSYATVNIACFLLEVSGTPNWRPEFIYFSWHGSLAGFALNMFAMFFVDYKFGCAALVCEIVVFVYLLYRAPQSSPVWGDVTQSVLFHQVRKYLLKLDSRKHHSKLWRPSILLFVDNSQLALIDFCNNLKKGGLYIVGSVLEGDFSQLSDSSMSVEERWIQFIDENNLKAFPKVAIAPTARVGYENLLLLSGLGAMQPNTVVLPLVKRRSKSAIVASLSGSSSSSSSSSSAASSSSSSSGSLSTPDSGNDESAVGGGVSSSAYETPSTVRRVNAAANLNALMCEESKMTAAVTADVDDETVAALDTLADDGYLEDDDLALQSEGMANQGSDGHSSGIKSGGIGITSSSKNRNGNNRANHHNGSLMNTKNKQMTLRRDVFADVPSQLNNVVVDSPALMDSLEYGRLLRHILHLNRNAVVTCNFDKLRHTLVVSSKLQSRVEAKSKRMKKRRMFQNQSGGVSGKKKMKMMMDQKPGQTEMTELIENGAGVSEAQMIDASAKAAVSSVIGSWIGSGGGGGSGSTSVNNAGDPSQSKMKEDHLKFVDVWLFADDYSYDLEDESMHGHVHHSSSSSSSSSNPSTMNLNATALGGGSAAKVQDSGVVNESAGLMKANKNNNDRSMSMFDDSVSQADRCFPMLLMQLAHVILRNKVWTRQAKLRAILIVPDNWHESPKREMFEQAVQSLRLRVDQIVTIASGVRSSRVSSKSPDRSGKKSGSPLSSSNRRGLNKNANNESDDDNDGGCLSLHSKPDWSWQCLCGTDASKEEVRLKKRSLKRYYRSLNRKMVEMSSETHLCFMALPPMPDERATEDHWTRLYFDCLNTLTRDLPPTALVATAERIPVMTIDV